MSIRVHLWFNKKGELVRQAVLSCCQLDLLSLRNHQKRALEAYRGSYISLGKLAEEMGMNIFAMRQWLFEHDISQNTIFIEDDLSNA